MRVHPGLLCTSLPSGPQPATLMTPCAELEAKSAVDVLGCQVRCVQSQGLGRGRTSSLVTSFEQAPSLKADIFFNVYVFLVIQAKCSENWNCTEKYAKEGVKNAVPKSKRSDLGDCKDTVNTLVHLILFFQVLLHMCMFMCVHRNKVFIRLSQCNLFCIKLG